MRCLPTLRFPVAVLGAAALGALTVLVVATPAQAAPAFQLPFRCGQVWSGATYTTHSPANAIDFNRTDDYGDAVTASAGGTVARVENTGSTSYGLWIEINHGGGWTSRYAHLSGELVTVGATVSAGQQIGTVGSTGGSTGPHLHFEQRLNGTAVKVVFGGSQALYWGTKSYTSNNACIGPAGTVNTAGASLTVRTSASTSASAIGSVPDGGTIFITCQRTGQTVTGTYGTSSWWDKVGAGYVADAYIYTGSDGRVAPLC